MPDTIGNKLTKNPSKTDRVSTDTLRSSQSAVSSPVSGDTSGPLSSLKSRSFFGRSQPPSLNSTYSRRNSAEESQQPSIRQLTISPPIQLLDSEPFYMIAAAGRSMHKPAVSAPEIPTVDNAAAWFDDSSVSKRRARSDSAPELFSASSPATKLNKNNKEHYYRYYHPPKQLKPLEVCRESTSEDRLDLSKKPDHLLAALNSHTETTSRTDAGAAKKAFMLKSLNTIGKPLTVNTDFANQNWQNATKASSSTSPITARLATIAQTPMSQDDAQMPSLSFSPESARDVRPLQTPTAHQFHHLNKDVTEFDEIDLSSSPPPVTPSTRPQSQRTSLSSTFNSRESLPFDLEDDPELRDGKKSIWQVHLERQQEADIQRQNPPQPTAALNSTGFDSWFTPDEWERHRQDFANLYLLNKHSSANQHLLDEIEHGMRGKNLFSKPDESPPRTPLLPMPSLTLSSQTGNMQQAQPAAKHRKAYSKASVFPGMPKHVKDMFKQLSSPEDRFHSRDADHGYREYCRRYRCCGK